MSGNLAPVPLSNLGRNQGRTLRSHSRRIDDGDATAAEIAVGKHSQQLLSLTRNRRRVKPLSARSADNGKEK